MGVPVISLEKGKHDYTISHSEFARLSTKAPMEQLSDDMLQHDLFAWTNHSRHEDLSFFDQNLLFGILVCNVREVCQDA